MRSCQRAAVRGDHEHANRGAQLPTPKTGERKRPRDSLLPDVPAEPDVSDRPATAPEPHQLQGGSTSKGLMRPLGTVARRGVTAKPALVQRAVWA